MNDEVVIVDQMQTLEFIECWKSQALEWSERLISKIA